MSERRNRKKQGLAKPYHRPISKLAKIVDLGALKVSPSNTYKLFSLLTGFICSHVEDQTHIGYFLGKEIWKRVEKKKYFTDYRGFKSIKYADMQCDN